MKDWKQLLAIAAIIMACGFLVRSFQDAHAQQTPMVNYGSIPYESFYGSTGNNVTTTLLTVPSDQSFMVTTLISNRSHYTNGLVGSHKCAITVDGVNAMGGDLAHLQNDHAFTQGNGHLVLSSGSVLSVVGYGSSCQYYVEGYYVHP